MAFRNLHYLERTYSNKINFKNLLGIMENI
jgi:hypothetical protein